MTEQLDSDVRAGYSHSQTGVLTLTLLAIPAVICLMLGLSGLWQTYPLAGLFFVVMVLFHSLTVKLDEVAIHLSYGIGLVRRSIPLERVAVCAPVRNRWFYGLGIRYVGTGWMWNIAGLDAVELTYTDGRQFRIGTDEPRELVEAITQAMASSETGVRRGYLGQTD